MKDELTIEKLENMKKAGFKLLGEIFKDTLAYIQIEREIKKLREAEVLK